MRIKKAPIINGNDEYDNLNYHHIAKNGLTARRVFCIKLLQKTPDFAFSSIVCQRRQNKDERVCIRRTLFSLNHGLFRWASYLKNKP